MTLKITLRRSTATIILSDWNIRQPSAAGLTADGNQAVQALIAVCTIVRGVKGGLEDGFYVSH